MIKIKDIYMRKVICTTDNFYHVYNRGTDKRKIFLDQKDYFRFIHDLFEFNNVDVVSNVNFRFTQAQKTENYGGPTSIVTRDLIMKEPRKRLVDIVSFCLMPNHFHFIFQQLIDGGITKFMQKLCTGYSMYFNQKYKRSGTLFQGRFKAILVDKDEYFLPLSGYIHANPIELIEPGWKENGIKNSTKVQNFLQKYRWSSYLDCIGIKNFPSVLNSAFLMDYFENKKDYQKYLLTYLSRDLEKIQSITCD